MQGEDTPVFLGQGLGLVPAVMNTIPCIIRTDTAGQWPGMPPAMSLCHCCPPIERGSLNWKQHNPLGRDALFGVFH